MRVLYPDCAGILKCWFFRRGKNPKIQRKTLGARRQPKKTQPTNDTWLELNPGHIGGRQALSRLHQTCSPPPHIFMFTCIEVTIKSSPKTYLLMKQLILCLRIISTFSFIFCYKSNIKAVIVLSSISMKNLKRE